VSNPYLTPLERELLAVLKDAELIIDRLWGITVARDDYGWDNDDQATWDAVRAAILTPLEPELLAVLKDAELIIDRLWGITVARDAYGWNSDDQATSDAVRAAIAKAEAGQ
jgi:hypothetical protein